MEDEAVAAEADDEIHALVQGVRFVGGVGVEVGGGGGAEGGRRGRELRRFDASHNCITGGLPSTFAKLKQLTSLNLSHNLIGTRPDSETSRDGWENFKNSALPQLSHFDLSHNQLGWDQKTFNEQVASLKEKKIRHLAFVANPFVEEVEAYRIWIISNSPKLIDLVRIGPHSRHLCLEPAAATSGSTGGTVHPGVVRSSPVPAGWRKGHSH